MGGQKSLREAAIAFLGDLLCLYDGVDCIMNSDI